MNLFLDTSALFKLYHKEDGTDKLMGFLMENSINSIYLSEITEIEFSSAVWKKCRKREIDENIAKTIIEKFDKDSTMYRFVQQNDELRRLAKRLIAKFWIDGLRTLDSIQLASALSIKEDIQRFFTADKLLANFAIQEGLNVKI